MVGDVSGGSDAYFDNDRAQIQERWDEGFEDPRRKRLEPLIRVYWDWTPMVVSAIRWPASSHQRGVRLDRRKLGRHHKWISDL